MTDNTNIQERKIALVIGAGDSLGGAIARRFAKAGFEVCVGRRNGDKLQPLVDEIIAMGAVAHPFAIDARREELVIELFDTIERDIGPLEVVVFNPGANIHFSILEMTSRKFYKVWEMACFAGFLTGREAARRMVPRKRGTMFFTGATASVRGGAGFSAFASAKMGLRALAQSMARELGPMGIHVAHVIIDGPIDTPWIREMFPDMVASKPEDGLLDPDDIAETYYQLYCQPRSAWTFEMDIRPWCETWTW